MKTVDSWKKAGVRTRHPDGEHDKARPAYEQAARMVSSGERSNEARDAGDAAVNRL